MVWDYRMDEDPVWLASSFNEWRANWAEEAVERLREVCEGRNDLTAIYELIGNLGHLYDRLVATHDLGEDLRALPTYGDVAARGLWHYECERGEGDDIEKTMRRG